MNNKNYWAERFEQLENAKHKTASQSILEIDRQFKKANERIEKEILLWYRRFSENNKITISEAKRWLITKEVEELKWDIKDYIKYAKENEISKNWIKELENASAKYHISRLESLKLRINNIVEEVYGKELVSVEDTIKKIYLNSYYYSAFEVQTGLGVGWNLASIDKDKLNNLIVKPWAVDGKNFSDRIWESKIKLINELNNQLVQNCILGKAPDEAIKNIAKKFGVSRSQAGRLVMTESAYFASESQRSCFNDLDVEQYQIIATLDLKTSEICRDLDLKIFNMQDFQVGITAPPFHPYCRTTTSPYFEDEYNAGERIARGKSGQTYYISKDMSYREWENKFLNKK